MCSGVLPVFWPQGVSACSVNNLITGLLSAWTVNRTWFSGRAPGSERRLIPVWFGDKLKSTEGKIKGKEWNGAELPAFPLTYFMTLWLQHLAKLHNNRKVFVTGTECLFKSRWRAQSDWHKELSICLWASVVAESSRSPWAKPWFCWRVTFSHLAWLDKLLLASEKWRRQRCSAGVVE